jgi:hypothetical protein
MSQDETMFLFYAEGKPWTNPKWDVKDKLVPLTDNEIKMLPWSDMRVILVMKHRICVAYRRDVNSVPELPQDTEKRSEDGNVLESRPTQLRIFLDRGDHMLAFCMGLHPRLGGSSPIKMLTPEFVRMLTPDLVRLSIGE